MFDLFQRQVGASFAQYTPPNWMNIKSQLGSNIQRIKRYYGENPTAVKADHILARLITSIAIPKSLELPRYYDNVQRVSMDVAMALFFTSSISFGRVKGNDFYNCPEIILADFSGFDYEYVDTHWRDVSAVKVDYHPYTDMNMILPEPSHYQQVNNLAVIRINPAMLMVQYRAFRAEEEAISSLTGEDQRSLYQFIRMHVLPNMLDTHLDHAVLNRMTRLINGVEMIPMRYRHSFALIEMQSKVDEALAQQIRYYSLANRSFEVMLHSVPLIAHSRMVDLLEKPEIAPTQQVMWALELSKLPAIRMLMLLSPDIAKTANASFINKTIRYLVQLKNNHILRRMLPANIVKEVELDVDDILNLLGRNY